MLTSLRTARITLIQISFSYYSFAFIWPESPLCPHSGWFPSWHGKGVAEMLYFAASAAPAPVQSGTGDLILWANTGRQELCLFSQQRNIVGLSCADQKQNEHPWSLAVMVLRVKWGWHESPKTVFFLFYLFSVCLTDILRNSFSKFKKKKRRPEDGLGEQRVERGKVLVGSAENNNAFHVSSSKLLCGLTLLTTLWHHRMLF